MVNSIFCEIHVKGHLSSQWHDWFGGLSVENQPGGKAVLSGVLPDQAALFGALGRVRDLGLALVSVHCTEVERCAHQDAKRSQGESCLASS
jgi:hypothetical protein